MSSSAALSAGPRPAPRYVDDVIRAAVVLTMFWGIAAFLVGVVIAAQLVWPQLSFDSEHLTFGRLRPLHTSAAIFAFGGTALIGTAFHVVQRTCRARLFGGAPLGWFVLLGYQFFIVIAATGYLLGITQSKEYAEPEWYADLWLTDRLGRLPHRLSRHGDEARGAAHLRRQLVLPRLHHHHRHAAHRQQPGDAGVVRRHQELRRLVGRAGRA